MIKIITVIIWRVQNNFPNMNTKKDGDMVRWVGLLLVENGKVLMVKEYDKNFFVLPGGRIEKSEGLEEALQRELSEELNVKAVNLEKYGEYRLRGKAEGSYMNFTVFTGDLVGNPVLGEDIEKMAWIDSEYKSQNLRVGVIAEKVLFPELVKKGMIK